MVQTLRSRPNYRSNLAPEVRFLLFCNTFLSSSTKNKYRYTLLLTNFYIHLLGIFYCFLTFYINLHV